MLARSLSTAALTRCLALSTTLSLVVPLSAQVPVTTSGTDQFTMKSRTNGVEYRVDVWLPPGLDTMTARPPVFLMTDGNLTFHTAHETIAMLAIGGEVAPVIVVGVSYPETDGRGYTPSYVVHRTRDYTPTNDAGMPGGGGSAAFLAFLKDELLPVVESRYRADPTRRGLGGHSLGGLFGTYALLHEPGLFSRYWISSPSLWWDHLVAFTWVAPATQRTTRPTGRAYITVGGDESEVMVAPMRRLVSTLTGAFPGLHVGSSVYPGESHASVVGGGMTRAFRYLYGSYGRPSIALPPGARAQYVGDWTAGGAIMHFRPSASGLTLSFSTLGQTIRAAVKVASRDTLFTTGAFTSEFVAVRDPSGRITALRGSMLGATQEYVRAPKP